MFSTLLGFCLVEPILGFSCATAAAPSPINVRLSEEEGVGNGSSATQPSHASVIILVVAMLIGAPLSGSAVGE